MMKKKMEEEREAVRSWHKIHDSIDFCFWITLSNFCEAALDKKHPEIQSR